MLFPRPQAQNLSAVAPARRQNPRNPPAPAGAKPISRRRHPRCVFRRGLHSEACANTCREQRVKADLLHRSDRPERSRILFVLFPSEQEKNTVFLFQKGKAFVLLFTEKKVKNFKVPLDKRKKTYYTISVKQRRTFSVLTLRRDVPGSISSENMRAQLLHGMLCIAG